MIYHIETYLSTRGISIIALRISKVRINFHVQLDHIADIFPISIYSFAALLVNYHYSRRCNVYHNSGDIHGFADNSRPRYQHASLQKV